MLLGMNDLGYPACIEVNHCNFYRVMKSSVQANNLNSPNYSGPANYIRAGSGVKVSPILMFVFLDNHYQYAAAKVHHATGLPGRSRAPSQFETVW
jgi:hypothetical protein